VWRVLLIHLHVSISYMYMSLGHLSVESDGREVARRSVDSSVGDPSQVGGGGGRSEKGKQEMENAKAILSQKTTSLTLTLTLIGGYSLSEDNEPNPNPNPNWRLFSLRRQRAWSYSRLQALETHSVSSHSWRERLIQIFVSFTDEHPSCSQPRGDTCLV